MAVAGFPLRRSTVSDRGRERGAHLHDASLRMGTQGTERTYGRVPRNHGKNTTRSLLRSPSKEARG